MFKHGFPPEWSTLKKLIWLVGTGIAGAASGIWKTVSGMLIHLTDALASPMQKCEVTLEPIQAGSGDPSPTNVRPITGWTGCEVTRTGKNLFAGYGENTYLKPNVQYIVSSGYISGGKRIRYKAFDRSGNQITPTITNSPRYYVSSNMIVRVGDTTSLDDTLTITNANLAYIVAIDDSASAYAYPNFPNIQIEVGNAKTDYEAFNGTTLSVTFPDSAGTVYGGTVDLVSGELSINKKILAFNSLTWTRDQQYSRFLSNAVPDVVQGQSARRVPSVCSAFPVVSDGRPVGEVPDNSAYWADTITSSQLCVKTSAWTTPSDFLNDMGNETIVYPINTPTEIQLTPQEISTLKGVNNVWSNSNGDTTIIYKAQAE